MKILYWWYRLRRDLTIFMAKMRVRYYLFRAEWYADLAKWHEWQGR